MADSVFGWPDLLRDDSDDEDRSFAAWAYAAKQELQPFYRVMNTPLPDNPVDLDRVVTQDIDGWLPRVAALAVLSEYFLDAAKERKWPPQIAPNGDKLTVTDREVRMASALAPYRLVRDEFDMLVKRGAERVHWAQSVRKSQAEAQ